MIFFSVDPAVEITFALAPDPLPATLLLPNILAN